MGLQTKEASHEAMNMASILKVPVIFYSINNGYGISTDIKKLQTLKNLYSRAACTTECQAFHRRRKRCFGCL